MSHILSIQQAAAQLGEIVRSLQPGDEIVLTDNEHPVARIVPSAVAAKREAGAWKGKFEIVNGDDGEDVILDHFRDYLP